MSPLSPFVVIGSVDFCVCLPCHPIYFIGQGNVNGAARNREDSSQLKKQRRQLRFKGHIAIFINFISDGVKKIFFSRGDKPIKFELKSAFP